MAERRALSKEEAEGSRHLDERMRDLRISSDELAGALGLKTRGAVDQWRRAELPIPLKRVAQVAMELDTDPSWLSRDWAIFVAPYLPSHSAQQAPAILEATMAVIDLVQERSPVPLAEDVLKQVATAARRAVIRVGHTAILSDPDATGEAADIVVREIRQKRG